MDRTRTGTARRTALVTGASGGIGEDLARAFAADGWDLVLVARGRPALERVAAELAERHGVSAHVVPADLARADAPRAVHDAVRALGVEVHALVNNAGFGLSGPFVATGPEAGTSLDGELDMLQVNAVALTHLSKLFLPEMVARGRGYVLNVASTAAFQPGPLMAVYYATKAYVLSFSEALAEELRATGVSVTCLAPGATRTGFQAVADMAESRLFRAGHVMSSEDVARAGYRGMLARRRLVIPGMVNRVMAHATRLVPRSTAARIARLGNQRA